MLRSVNFHTCVCSFCSVYCSKLEVPFRVYSFISKNDGSIVIDTMIGSRINLTHLLELTVPLAMMFSK